MFMGCKMKLVSVIKAFEEKGGSIMNQYRNI